MLKVISTIIVASSLPIVYDGATKIALAECNASREGIYSTIISKVETSDIATPKEISCTEIIEINKQNPVNLLLTSGRKRGKYTICLSDNSSNPCKYVIGTFNENRNPSDMLSQVFDFPQPKRTQLNETVERLFLKPSLLIQ